LTLAKRAPEKRREIWRKAGITPRGIDRETSEMMHRTHIGVDNGWQSLLLHGLRNALSDGWGGSMIATEVSDILFGTPKPTPNMVNIGVLKEDEVNIVVHGHNPVVSEKVLEACASAEMVKLARDKGAKGINLVGVCCTGTELLMRHGIPMAGNFLMSELILGTGSVEMMIVDYQCIMPSLGATIAPHYHTKMVSTSDKPVSRGWNIGSFIRIMRPNLPGSWSGKPSKILTGVVKFTFRFNQRHRWAVFPSRRLSGRWVVLPSH